MLTKHMQRAGLALLLTISVAGTAFADDNDPISSTPQTAVNSNTETLQTESATTANELPHSMKNVDCAVLLSWLKSAAPNDSDAKKINNEIYEKKVKARNRQQKKGIYGRRSYAEGTQLFENLISMLASGYDSFEIADQFAQYVDPAVDEAKKVVLLAREIHMASGAQREALVKRYVKSSERLGRHYSRYSLVMGTLISIASGKGIANIKTVPKAPTQDEQSGAAVSALNEAADSTEKLVYDLTNPAVAQRAREVLEALDRENVQKGLPDLEIPVSADVASLPYPSFQVVHTIYANNLYAILANRTWDLRQQNYSSRPLIWLAQFASDWAVNSAFNVTSKLPQSLQAFARTLSGIGNASSVTSRYLPDLLEIARITRFANEKGDMVISTNDYYVDLQIQRLIDRNSAGFNDEELTTLARLLWHTDVWAHIVQRVADRAGIKVSSKWAPKSLQDSIPLTTPQKPPNLIHGILPILKRGAKPGIVIAQEENIPPGETPAHSDPKPTPEPAPKPAPTPNPAPATNTIVATPGASQIWAYRLQQLLNAEQRAESLGPIPFATPRTMGVAVRFLLMQVGWGTLAVKAYQNWPMFAHHTWPWVVQHIFVPLSSIL